MDSDLSRSFVQARIPETISGVGGVLFLVFALEWAFFSDIGMLLGSENFFVSLIIAVGFSVGIIYGGYWLDRSDLSPNRYPRIGAWFVGGIAFYLGINVLLMFMTSSIAPQLLIEWIRFSVAIGSAGGFLMGVVEARAIQREISAERAAVRAEKAEQQREYLDYLNSLLRHEVLNTANVITGYTSVLLDKEGFEESTYTQLETIQQQGEDMTNVIQDVQVLIAATRGIVELESMDLSEVLIAEIDELKSVSDSVEVDASIPDDVYVKGDELLPRVFTNLLKNAVEYNERDTAHIDIRVESDSETVAVYVADDGPGIPADERTTLFKRGDNTGANHGIGLYLVQTLVQRYEGAVELVETGPDGSVFAIELRAAAAPTDESESSSPTDSGSVPSRGTAELD